MDFIYRNRYGLIFFGFLCLVAVGLSVGIGTPSYSERIQYGAQIYVHNTFPGKKGVITCDISRGISNPSVNIVPCSVGFDDGTRVYIECRVSLCDTGLLPVIIGAIQ